MGNRLRDLRLSQSLSSQEMVDTVREIYPKYDKPMQSKCESSDLYGVELRRDALKALYMKYNPEEWTKRQKASDGHRLSCRISCRLKDAEYERLKHLVEADGYPTMQDWLSAMVREYIQKAGEGNAE